MNEILQQRIEEAAKVFAESEVAKMDNSSYSMHERKRLKMFDGYDIEEYLTTFSEKVLQNQWISVEEALPEEVQEGCCDDKFVLYCGEYPATASYDNKRKKWYYGDYEILGVTHWMPIPSLNGGEK